MPMRCRAASSSSPSRCSICARKIRTSSGSVMKTKPPLLDLCAQDPDELAFLLGHEMGHVLRGHARSQLTARTLLQAVTARLAGAGLMLRQLLNQGYSRE